MTDPANKAARLPSALDLEIPALVRGRRVSVFLDYDGTLSPIVERPADAALSADMHRTIERLGERTPVAVVSGRDLADVRARVGVDGVWYAGSHGLDLAAPDGGEAHLQEAMALVPKLDAAEAVMRGAVEAIAGAWVERKRFSVALHYRQTPEARIPAVESAVRRALAHCPGLSDVPGKMVHDLRPAIDWDKGKAMLWMLKQMAPAGRDDLADLPVYIGDDTTDEDAFAAIDGSGIAVVVRTEPHPTGANHELRDTDEVRRFLERLWEALPPPGRAD